MKVLISIKMYAHIPKLDKNMKYLISTKYFMNHAYYTSLNQFCAQIILILPLAFDGRIFVEYKLITVF